MRSLLWFSRVVLFLVIFAFAIKNTDPVGVRFFLDTVWQAPLVIVLLVSFAGGAVFAVLSLLGTLFSQRREVNRLKRELKVAQDRVMGSQGRPM
ncbi:lipopolysaccharide assembly LapA domain-containing protein [Accumulibacter sp.]|uniref:LapA family protein n=1 Tax=Accumulibacter sp. TaxID=2053492 RepID=UPI002637B327|nr:LapA family protein [Accumulibacter sp.]